MYRDANVPTLGLRGQGSTGCFRCARFRLAQGWEESEYRQRVTLRISDHQACQCFDENHLFGSEEWAKHESKSGGEKSRRRGPAKGPIDNMKYHVISVDSVHPEPSTSSL